MTNVNYFLGYPDYFRNKIKIYPPTINDIVLNKNFFNLVNFFVISQEDIEDEFVKQDLPLSDLLSPYEWLIAMAYNDKESYNMIQQAFELFIHSRVTFLFELKKIVIGASEEVLTNINNIEDIVFLTEEEYFDFQNKIRETIGMSPVEPYNPNEHPKIRAMKAKARYRDRVKAKRSTGLSLYSTLSSICCMGIGLNPLNIGELSYVAAIELIQRYSEKEKFDIDLHTIWAGVDQKKHKITPKHWIRNLDKK